ncbi:hypothetical protein H6F67_16045 [Microcoleus sp. FACHB-1515]|uniref:YfaP family protein n=1 Tax=Cyanophyceae TaxID=3028117 RepID=UPI001689950E|nr:hypothetical protein [Microcoleus sp. FACHB-1515]MBD2091359.1 hypothetical protein [Microcoleus sp. FACHB-1515]
MQKLLRSVAVAPLLAVPLVMGIWAVHQPKAIAQERQGCFMITSTGQLIDLGEICPSSQQVATAEAPTLGTGDIQVTLRWTTSDDLDLGVTDPQGQTVTYFNRQVSSGGQLDVDANAGCSSSTTSPIENIFWPPSQAPQGNYQVEVNLYTRCQPSSSPIPFTLTLLVQGATQTLTGSVSDQNPTATFSFSLPPR